MDGEVLADLERLRLPAPSTKTLISLARKMEKAPGRLRRDIFAPSTCAPASGNGSPHSPATGGTRSDTWQGDSWKTAGSANVWGGFSIDEKRGLVFAGTGSATFDFYGGKRPGQNLFANCVVALDAATGKRRWHYQIVHHDLWDYDMPTAPILARVKGKDAVVQITKQGFVFVFDRETGQPLFPIEERPVPASDIPGRESLAHPAFSTEAAAVRGPAL